MEDKIKKIHLLTKFASLIFMIGSNDKKLKKQIFHYLGNPSYENMYILMCEIEDSAIAFISDEENHIQKFNELADTIKNDIKHRLELFEKNKKEKD